MKCEITVEVILMYVVVYNLHCSDPKNYQALEKEVSGRLQTPEAQQRWQAHCGLASFVTAVTKVVLTEVRRAVLFVNVLFYRAVVSTVHGAKLAWTIISCLSVIIATIQVTSLIFTILFVSRNPAFLCCSDA